MSKERVPNPNASALESKKKQIYERLCGGNPDVLFILARGVVENEATGEFKSLGYGDTDSHGMMGGGKARSIAAAELHHFFPDSSVVANSLIQQMPASMARVTAQELKKRGVDQEKMIIQENSYSTFTELIELIRLIVQNNWHNAVVIANEFHIQRAQAMLIHINDLHDPNGYSEKPEVREALRKFKETQSVHIAFVSAEEVLLAANPHYKKVIDAARKLPAWKETVEKERVATIQVQEGEYWRNSPSTTIKK